MSALRRPNWLGFPGGFLAVLGCALVLGFVLLLELPESEKGRPRDPSAASVELLRLNAGNTDLVLREEAALRDPSPLFLPTPLNAAQQVRPESRLREPGDSFIGYSRRFVFSDARIDLRLPDPIRPPARPVEELARQAWDHPFPGIGQAEMAPVVLEPRVALLEIRRSKDGSVLYRERITDLALPQNLDWRPCEFLVQTDSAGLLGRIPLVQSSGFQSSDQQFSDYLERHWTRFELMAKLPAGVYRILLGP